MAHSICITYNYCREDNTGWWVTVEDRGTEWTFDYREGSRSGTRRPEKQGLAPPDEGVPPLHGRHRLDHELS